MIISTTRKIRSLIGIAIICAILCTLSACGKDKQKTDTSKSIIYTDAMQRQVNIPQVPKRIVSMAPSNTEMLFAIGLNEEIVGVTKFCDYPESAKSKRKIGGYSSPNIETILTLKPDLIIATPDGYVKKSLEVLESAGIAIFIVNPKNIDGILDTMLMLGKITGKEENARKVVEKLAIRVKYVKEKTADIPMEMRPKVFYEIGHDPIITAGPGTFVNSVITEAGGINIASDAKTDWQRYSVEAIITKEPDIIITAPHANSDNNGEMLISLDSWQRFSTIPAVKNNRIYPLYSNILLRPGPRIIDGLEAMHTIFEEFWKNRKNAKTE